MRRSMAGAIAAHMQRQAVLSRHEGAGEALAQMALCGGPAASLVKGSFRLASVKKHHADSLRLLWLQGGGNADYRRRRPEKREAVGRPPFPWRRKPGRPQS